MLRKEGEMLGGSLVFPAAAFDTPTKLHPSGFYP